MREVLVIAIGCIFIGSVSAQVRGRPDSTPISQTQKAVNRANDLNRRTNELRNVEKFPVQNRQARRIFLKRIKPLYRKPTSEEMKALAPEEDILTGNAEFMKGKKSGIVKLMLDRNCTDELAVVKATPECARYSMPGSGSAYSFRERTYRLVRLSDLNFRKNTLQALGMLTHGIMANIGDVPINSVNLQSQGTKFLTAFKSAKDMRSAADIANKLRKGIKNDGVFYSSVLPAKVNSTYIFRSIAYRGEAWRTMGGYPYNELERDKRRDVILVFRVVRLNTNESITLLWKELSSKKAPKIKSKK